MIPRLAIALVGLAAISATALEPDSVVSDPWPLDACPMSGAKLAGIPEPIIADIDGREVRFCCNGCLGNFQKDKEAQFKKADAAIADLQRRDYPLTTCIVMDEAFDEEDGATELVYGNRLFRLCCGMCVRKFKESPAEYVAAVDKAIIAAQLPHYPMDTCIIGGGPLDGMGGPIDMVIGNRLVRLCCDHCRGEVEANAHSVLARLDKAAADAQRKTYPHATCPISGRDLGGVPNPIEVIAGGKLVRFCCNNCVKKFNNDPQAGLAKLAATKIDDEG